MNSGEVENLISKVIMLLDSNVQCSTKKSQGIQNKTEQKLEKYGSFKGNKLTKSVPEKDLMADILDKDFKIIVLKMLKKTKRRCKKNQANNVCKKGKYQYREKALKGTKSHSGAEKYIDSNEKFS